MTTPAHLRAAPLGPRAGAMAWAAALLVASQCAAPAGDGSSFAPGGYPCWRGPGGSGVVDSGRKLVESAADVKLLWKSEFQDLPNGWLHPNGRSNIGIVGGYCGPVVAGGKVFVYYYVPSGTAVDEATLKIAKDQRREKWLVSADDIVLCIDAANGKTLWKAVMKEKGLNFNFDQQGPLLHPCVVGDRVYAMGTAGRVYCLDAANGTLLWESNLGKAAEVLEGVRKSGKMFDPKQAAALNSCPAHAAGVIVCNDHCQVLSGGETSACGLVGLDAATGKHLWNVPDCVTAVGSPVRWVDSNTEYVVAAGPSRAVCLEPQTGKLMWEAEGRLNYKGTVAVSGQYLVCSGAPAQKEGRGETRRIIEAVGPTCFRISPRGAQKLWSVAVADPNYRGPSWGSSLIYGGRAFVDGKIIELETGKVLGACPGGIGSPVAGDGRLVFGAKLLDAESLKDLGAFKASYEPFTTPALADGRLYVRGPREPGGSLGRRAPGCIYSFELRKP